MSEKYKEAMDKIVVSDELKAKIINNAVLYNAADKPKSKRSGFVYLRYGMGYAACLALCLYAVSTSDNYINTHDFQAVSVTAEPKAAAESVVTETPKTAEKIADAPKQAEMQENTVQKSSAVEKSVKNNKSSNSSKAVPTVNNRGRAIYTQSNAVAEPVTGQTETAKTSLPNENTEVVLQSEQPEQAAFAASPETAVSKTGGAGGGAAADYSGGYMLRSVVEPKISSIEDIENSVGYRIKTPQYMPDGYKLESVGVIADSTVQMSYTAPDDEITYRTEKNDSGEERDISGNYEEYENVSTENINGNDVTIKSSGDSYYNAVWNDDSSYSLDSSNGIEKDDMVRIIESVDYCESEKIPNSIDIME